VQPSRLKCGLGFETNQEYINIAEARLSAYPKQKLLGD